MNAFRPTTTRVLSFRFIALVLAPTFAVLGAAEAAVRLKYFFAHGHDWFYLTTPVSLSHTGDWVSPDGTSVDDSHRGDAVSTDRTPISDSRQGDAVSKDRAPISDSRQGDAVSKDRTPFSDSRQGGTVPNDTTLSGGSSRASPASNDHLVFVWPRPCVNTTVYSTERRTMMPRTTDENCFRGDRVSRQKPGDEYRIVFVGGSTVEDGQSDAEMMTAQFKRALPSTHDGKRVTVVNAGRSGYNSEKILESYQSTLSAFSPDLVLYYEAWNEMPTDMRHLQRVDVLVEALRTRVHRALHYRFMLYTYLVEKYAFIRARGERPQFWKIDVNVLQRNFTELADQVRRRGAAFVFVTQVVQFPRMWKGVDTFDYRDVDALLDRLKLDPQYRWDINEISALNQRLALFYTIDLCRKANIPVINVLEPIEALGSRRGEMFIDGIHLSVKGDELIGALIAKQLEGVVLNAGVRGGAEGTTDRQ